LDQEEKIVNVLQAGSYFGEISLITNLKTTATVRAVESCTLGSINKKTLEVLKEEYPSLHIKLFYHLSFY